MRRNDSPCAVTGCEVRQKSRGYCGKHHQRWIKHGDATYERPRPTPLERLLAKVRVDENGCWLWQASKIDGYGVFFYGSRAKIIERRAHRASYRLAGNDIPAGYEVDHLCRVRACVNPAHLEAVTPQVNFARAKPFLVGRRPTHCKRGHAFDETNTLHYQWNGKAKRGCRTCQNLGQLRRYHERRGALMKMQER